MPFQNNPTKMLTRCHLFVDDQEGYVTFELIKKLCSLTMGGLYLGFLEKHHITITLFVAIS